ncbi:BTB/POZ domain-containing protein kctd3 [Sorochytrium milnesiophthora]
MTIVRSDEPSADDTIAKDSASPDTVLLDVSGTHFKVSRSTLAPPGSEGTFFHALLSGRHKVAPNKEDGSIFISRSARLFEVVLQFLRNGRLSLPAAITAEEVRHELQYYGLTNTPFDATPGTRTYKVTELHRTKAESTDLTATLRFQCTQHRHVSITKIRLRLTDDNVVYPTRGQAVASVSASPVKGGQPIFCLIDFGTPPELPHGQLPLVLPYVVQPDGICHYFVDLKLPKQQLEGASPTGSIVEIETTVTYTFTDDEEVLPNGIPGSDVNGYVARLSLSLARKDMQISPPSSPHLPDDIVRLDVGGTRFKVKRSTLLWPQCEGNFFHALLSGRHTVQTTENGDIYIDRSPRVFDVVLQFLRNNELRIPYNVTVEEVRQEAEFFGLSELAAPIPPSAALPRRFSTKEHLAMQVSSVRTGALGQQEVVGTATVSCTPRRTVCLVAYVFGADRHSAALPSEGQLWAVAADSAQVSASAKRFVLVDFRTPKELNRAFPIELPYLPQPHGTCFYHLEFHMPYADRLYIPYMRCDVEISYEFDEQDQVAAPLRSLTL